MIKTPHFHPNSHECYGKRPHSRLHSSPSDNTISAIFQGKSRLILGREQDDAAPGGIEVDVAAGDVIVIPAGVSHRSLTSEDDYRYIGVYPEVSAQIFFLCF